MIESMEPRRLMAVSPVTAVTMTGTAGQITSVTLTFSVPLDAASAQNVNSYSISKKTKGEDSSIGVIDTSTDGTTRRVRFASAVYDPAARTVTLTPTDPFDLGRKFRRLRVSGAGPNVVKETTGAAIDGDGNGKAGGAVLIHSRVVRASGFTFREGDRDKARLRLTGPGTLRVWSDRKWTIPPVVFMVGTDPARSTLTGSVVSNRRHGDGIVRIREISQTSQAAVPILTNPAFQVDVVNP